MKIIEIAKGKLGRGVHQYIRHFRYFAVFNTRRHARYSLSLSLSLSFPSLCPFSRHVTSNILIKQTCPEIRQVPISAPRHERRKINVP